MVTYPVAGCQYLVPLDGQKISMADRDQIRAAMGLLGWAGKTLLAERAGMKANTISRVIRGDDVLASTLERLQAILEEAGVKFIPGGVRWRDAANPAHGGTAEPQESDWTS